MKRAILIAPGNYVAPLLIPDSGNEELQILNEAVGGWIEMVPHRIPNFTVYCNEEGKLRGMEYNALADEIFSVPGDALVGPIVILGPIDENGDTLGLSEEQVSIFLSADGEDVLNALAGLDA